MQHTSRGRRLVAAVTVVLAVTAGTLAAGPAALAAPGTASAQATTAAPVPIDRNARVLAAGTTGFLVSATYDTPSRWIRYADGAVTDLKAPGVVDSTGTDVLAFGDTYKPVSRFRTVTLRNMGDANAAPVVFDLAALNATYVEAVGPATILAEVASPDATKNLVLFTKDGDTVTPREITGLPADAHGFVTDAPSVGGSALVSYATDAVAGHRGGLAVIDLATGTATATYSSVQVPGSMTALSATRVAWSGWDDTGSYVRVVDRATGREQRHAWGGGDSEELYLSLVGDWLVYGSTSDLLGDWDGPRRPVTAVPLATQGQPVELLAYTSRATPGADGTLLLDGGTLAKGEGVYRVSPGQDGTLATELVASTGGTTALRHTATHVPDVIDFDRDRMVGLDWHLNRSNVLAKVTLTHQRTGQSYVRTLQPRHESGDDVTGDGGIGFVWHGTFNDWADPADPTEYPKTAFNGDYTWTFEAKPRNGIGPDVKVSGTFKVVRSVKPHDYGDNGSPDLLTRDPAGKLWRIDTSHEPSYGTIKGRNPVATGTGWQIYDRIEAAGNLGGSPVGDQIARETNGSLWLYQGTGDEKAPFSARTRIGTGWHIYDKIAGGSDLTGDRKADVLATDTSGRLWLYPGTGNAAAPLGARKQIGTGWGVYNEITATGDLGGAPAGDLVARDRDGVLWLYLGKGDGTLAPRTKIGTGWNAFTGLVGIGDATRDGRADLLAYGPNNTVYVYPGTGSWSAPFGLRASSSVLANTGTHNLVF